MHGNQATYPEVVGIHAYIERYIAGAECKQDACDRVANYFVVTRNSRQDGSPPSTITLQSNGRTVEWLVPYILQLHDTAKRSNTSSEREKGDGHGFNCLRNVHGKV